MRSGCKVTSRLVEPSVAPEYGAHPSPEMGSPLPELSVVVLCYRSGHRIRPFIDSLRRTLDDVVDDWELVLVANEGSGSDDPTPAIVAELARDDPRLRPVLKVKRGMMGWDMRSGLEEARGRLLAVIDGDGQMPAEDVTRVYETWKETGCDLVKTFRRERLDGLVRQSLSAVYNFLFRALFPGLGCRDVNAKPKLFTREAFGLMELTSDGWFVDTEMMIQVRRLGLRIAEIPTSFRALEGRRSFVSPAAIAEFLRELVVHKIRDLRTRRVRRPD